MAAVYKVLLQSIARELTLESDVERRLALLTWRDHIEFRILKQLGF